MRPSPKRSKAPEISADKAFLQSFTVSILCILICIVALCSATWAWFSGTVSSDENIIQTANCTLTITATDSTESVLLQDGGEFLFLANVPYTVTISAEGTARSAYAIFATETSNYYTESVNPSANDTIEFALLFSKDTSITVRHRWGIPNRETRELTNGSSYLNMATTPETE